MRGISKVLTAITGNRPLKGDRYTSWTKQLFNSDGQEIEIVNFEKFYFVANSPRWLRQQFSEDGLYWLVFSSNEADRPYGALWLLSVRKNRRDVGYTMLSFGSAEETLAAYNTGAIVDDHQVIIPDAVRAAALQLVPTRS